MQLSSLIFLNYFQALCKSYNTFNSLANTESDSKPKAFDSLFYSNY